MYSTDLKNSEADFTRLVITLPRLSLLCDLPITKRMFRHEQLRLLSDCHRYHVNGIAEQAVLNVFLAHNATDGLTRMKTFGEQKTKNSTRTFLRNLYRISH